ARRGRASGAGASFWETSHMCRALAPSSALRRVSRSVHTLYVQRARRHPRLLSWLAFGLAALVAELVGRALTARLDVGRHVASPSYAGADYYPALLAVVKIGIALLLARLAWRVARARALEQAGRSLLDRAGR